MSSKSIHIILSYTVSKFVRFLRLSVCSMCYTLTVAATCETLLKHGHTL